MHRCQTKFPNFAFPQFVTIHTKQTTIYSGKYFHVKLLWNLWDIKQTKAHLIIQIVGEMENKLVNSTFIKVLDIYIVIVTNLRR